jgi:hypothetical protein
VVPDQVQEGRPGGELAGAGHGVAVAQGPLLDDELQAGGVLPGGAGVRGLVPRRDDDGHLLHPGVQRLLYQDGQHRLLDAVAVDQRLHR